MKRLIDFRKVPPGDYFYDQVFERDGKRYNKHFQRTPEAGTLAARISRFRKVNNLPRSDVMEALEDLDQFTVARLPENSKWVIDTDVPFSQIVASVYGPSCATCGHTSPPQ